MAATERSPDEEGFETWMRGLTAGQSDDPGAGTAAGAVEFLREVFETHGPVSEEELEELWALREVDLARAAVKLVVADIQATTTIRPNIKVRRREGLLIVSFNGSYQTPPMVSMRAPESICEIADNLSDHVMDEVWTVWPVCPEHDRKLSARPRHGKAIWMCPSGGHAVAEIGSLGR